MNKQIKNTKYKHTMEQHSEWSSDTRYDTDKPWQNYPTWRTQEFFSPYEKYLEWAKSRAQKAREGYQGFGASGGGRVSVHVIFETANSSPSWPCCLQPRRIPWECFPGLANGARCETLGSLSFWLLKWYLSAVLISVFFLQYNAFKKSFLIMF